MLINISSIAPLNGEKNDMTSHGMNEFSEIEYEIVSIFPPNSIAVPILYGSI